MLYAPEAAAPVSDDLQQMSVPCTQPAGRKVTKTLMLSPGLKPFGLIAKPAGPLCNLNCTYCYYLEKKHLYPGAQKLRMPDAILDEFIKQYIESQDVPMVTFIWQGGEPCLAGLEFYSKAVALQKKYADGKKIENAFQTNGMLLNEAWCRFLYENQFLTGISIDGPRELHDFYRQDCNGKGTFDKVMRGIDLLSKHRVEFNTLTVVHAQNVEYPLELYHFLKSIGSHYIQFLPVVERMTTEKRPDGLNLVADASEKEAAVTEWSVDPGKYGVFLARIFDEWVHQDVGSCFIQLFDATLANWIGVPPGLCFFMHDCGAAGAIEHNGDVYSCDHFVSPGYHLGNIQENPLKELMNSARQQQFGRTKSAQLPKACQECTFLDKCYGECPKKRFLATPEGEYGLNYLCEGYRHFFAHVTPAMNFMANELLQHRPPANIMNFMRNK